MTDAKALPKSLCCGADVLPYTRIPSSLLNYWCTKCKKPCKEVYERADGEELDEPRKSIVEFLEKEGWGVALAGNTMVVQNPNNPLKLNRWFVMEFIGVKKDV